jgi:hypothetical protein
MHGLSDNELQIITALTGNAVANALDLGQFMVFPERICFRNNSNEH